MVEIANTRIRSSGALVMPKMAIQEFPMCRLAEENVSNGRQQLQAALDGTPNAPKVLILQIEPNSVYDKVTMSELVTSIGIRSREWTRLGVSVLPIIEFSVQQLLDSYMQPDTGALFDKKNKAPQVEAGSFNRALLAVRELFCEFNRMGLAIGASLDDPLMPQYFGDQLIWCCFRENNVESQLHRQLASAMSMPVGFAPASVEKGPGKALDACLSAQGEHSFFSLTKDGVAALVNSSGNSYSHIVVPEKVSKEAISGLVEQCKAKKVNSCVICQVDLNLATSDMNEICSIGECAGIRIALPDQASSSDHTFFDSLSDIFGNEILSRKQQKVN